MSNIIKLNDVYNSFYQGAHHLKILKGINLKITSAEVVALVGPSGAGKSTLVDIILGLIQPTFGEMVVDGIKMQIH